MVYTLAMVTELDKYRAQYFQISGFCLMSPLGKIILNLFDYELKEILTIKFLICSVIALLLFYLGLVLIFKGEEKLEEW